MANGVIDFKNMSLEQMNFCAAFVAEESKVTRAVKKRGLKVIEEVGGRVERYLGLGLRVQKRMFVGVK